MKLDPWQKKFLDTKGDKLLCSGRQVGKSIICGKDCKNYAVKHPNKSVLMMAPTERQSYALFSKTLDEIFSTHPKMIMKGKDRPTKTRIKLTNGTTIWCLPTGLTGLGIRFLTIDRLYGEEASRIPLMVWDAVTPMLLTTGGDTILLSTPFGTQGYFYDALINKNNGFDTYTRFRTDSETVMREREICVTWTQLQRDKALVRLTQEKARMTALAFAQEYMGQPLNDLLQVFPDKLLEKVMVLARRPHIRPYRKYFLGQDVADMGKDTSTWELLDGTEAKSVEHIENITKKRIRCPERVKTTLDLEMSYNFKKIGIDNQGVGSGDFGYLLKENSTKRKIIPLNNASKDLNQDGTKQSKLLKEDMYNNLVAMMEMGEIKLLQDDSIFHSLRSVQHEKSGKKTTYSGNDTHIAEGLIRAAWLVRTKSLNMYIHFQ
ncbi:hypothetical protein LCGC14_1407430 [marine sediment metagenome]|uniref:Uncharacterized protein n=1 Tax=marine sediment metagenome TaxID=412755 RepID=A0A0F9JVJ1_9ZZZZ